ncbi:MAG: hypothetical protein AAGA08_13205 [Pseudomonadota bacterium]
MSALGQSARVTEIGQDFEELALVGTQFEDALITTQNDAALIAGRGGYGALQRMDMPLRLSRSSNRVDMRFNADHRMQMLRAETDADEPSSIIICDPLGQVRHRIQYMTAYDCRIAQCLSAQPNVNPQVERDDEADNVISLAAIRAARENWRKHDIGAHLNDFLLDGGRGRGCVLPHVSASMAWKILPDVLTSFFTYLSNRKISHARVVCSGGVAQADVSPIDTVDALGSVILGRREQNSFSVDMSRIGTAWVTVHAQTWLLELFDHDGMGAAVLAADPMENTKVWNELLCSLPRPR